MKVASLEEVAMVRMINTTEMRAKLLADLALIQRALGGEQLTDADKAEAKAFCNGILKLIDPGLGGAAGGEAFVYQLSMAIPLTLLQGEEYDLTALEAARADAAE